MNKSDDEREAYERYQAEWYSEPFPPAAHPVREAITMTIAAILVIGGIGWIIWRFS